MPHRPTLSSGAMLSIIDPLNEAGRAWEDSKATCLYPFGNILLFPFLSMTFAGSLLGPCHDWPDLQPSAQIHPYLNRLSLENIATFVIIAQCNLWPYSGCHKIGQRRGVYWYNWTLKICIDSQLTKQSNSGAYAGNTAVFLWEKEILMSKTPRLAA